jgi:putative flippase GtrA
MKQLISVLFQRFQNLILYGIIGSFSAGIDFLIFYVLTHTFGVYYLTANFISVSFGITTSFILNKNYNFKVKDQVFRRFLIFFSIGLSGLFVSSALLYFFINYFHLTKIFAKLMSIVFVILIQFVLNKYVTFRKKLI